MPLIVPNRRDFVVLGLASVAAGSLGPTGLARADAAKGYVDGDVTLGSPDAPVEIIEYASMTCPHCASFHQETMPELKKRFIDTGKVKLKFREFPFDQWALRASMVARCSGPTQFYAMIDLLFDKQKEWARGSNPDEISDAIFSVARLAGMTREQFDTCMEDKELADAILATRLHGQEKWGVDSTPSFIIDGKKYAGSLPIEDIEKLIAPLLPKG